MKLFLYDKFLDAFSKLPKAIQKKTTEFLKKFRENPTASSINMERISSFSDRNLRTVRIDLAYRAVIYVSEDSSVFHLLWVDHHDDAIRWGTNKRFNWNRETQAYELYDVASEPVFESVPGKDKEVLVFDGITDEQLIKIGIPENLIEQVREISSYEELEALEKLLPEFAFENVFSVFDGNSIESVIERVIEGKVSSEDISAQELSPNNRRNFHLISNDAELDEILSGEFDKWKLFLHPTQYLIAYKDYNGSIKVSGAAGTGKTVAAIHRAKYLTNKMDKTDKPVLFTTFTRALVSNIESIFYSMDFDMSKVVIKNLHAFVCDFAKQKNLVPQKVLVLDEFEQMEYKLWNQVLDDSLSKYGQEFLKEEYKNVILYNNITALEEYLNVPRRGRNIKLGRKDKIEIWGLCEKFKKLKEEFSYLYYDEVTNIVSNSLRNGACEAPFSYIVCDELQDFSNIELKLMRQLVVEKPNDLSLFGDPLQNIYNKRIVFSEIGINIRGTRSKKLLLNYRTTEEIRRSAYRVIRDVGFDDFDNNAESRSGYLSILHGTEPGYRLFNNYQDELQFITETIKELMLDQEEKQIEFQEICIASRRNDNIKEIMSFLHSLNIPYYDIRSKKGNNVDGIRLATFHNLKGLEFKAVFLTGINKNSFPLLPRNYQYMATNKKEEHIKSEKSLIYVAMTRARDILFITGTGEPCDLLKDMVLSDRVIP